MTVNAPSETGTFQDRIEAINLQLGDVAGGTAAGKKQQNRIRSLFVNGRLNGVGYFAHTLSASGSFDRQSISDMPGVIFAVDGDGDCEYEREDEFLSWAVEQEFDEIILYNIGDLLRYGHRKLVDYYPFPSQGTNNINIMGESESIEWHLTRFIYKARTQYGLDVVSVVNGGTGDAAEMDEEGFDKFYRFHINSPSTFDSSSTDYEDYLHLFEDFSEDFFNKYLDQYQENPEELSYKDYGEDTLFLPRDAEDRISTIDKIIVDVYNLYVFHLRATNNYIVTAGGGGPDAPASCNSLPLGEDCNKSFMGHLYEWEWFDNTGDNSGQQADFELEAVVEFIGMVNEAFGVGGEYQEGDPLICPFGNFLVQGRTDFHKWNIGSNQSQFTPQQRVNKIDEVAHRVYFYAYKNNPCDCYNSTQDDPDNGRIFHENVDLFANNNRGAYNGQTVIVPVFNAKYYSADHWGEDRPEKYGDNKSGCESKNTNKHPCDFCTDYSGNALNSLAPHYPKQMGFVENVFQDQYDLDAANTSPANSDNIIYGCCWFKSSLLLENDVISGIGEKVGTHTQKNTRVYPNPSNTGEFIIQAEGEIQQVEIFTTAGRLIYSTRSKNFQQTVQLHSKGIYILRVKTSDGRIENHKIVSH